MRYVYNISENKVVCVSRFAGKAVRGIAKCDTEFDVFDEEAGKKLARLRCDNKVSEKRFARAQAKYYEALEACKLAQERCEAMRDYFFDAEKLLVESRKELQEYEQELQ